MNTIDISGIVIFNEGPQGQDHYTGDDLQAMVDAHGKLGFQPPIKLIEDGNDKRTFGSPALGYVARLYRQGTKCSSKVNLTGVNGNVIMSGWKDDNPDNERRETVRGNPTSVS
jgi:hypothetical protein